MDFVHTRLLTCPTSTILVSMMHLRMITAMNASDAVCDLHVTHEQLGYLGPYLFTDMSQLKTMLRNEVSLAGGGCISGLINIPVFI